MNPYPEIATSNTSGYVPSFYTQAPIENRIACLVNGGEAYFTNDEANLVVRLLSASGFDSMIVRFNCPSEGYTRIGAWPSHGKLL